MGIGLKDCKLCNGEGYIKNKFGLKVECECVLKIKKATLEKKEIVRQEPVVSVGEAVKSKAIELGYIPAHRIEDEFDIDTLASNIGAMIGNCGVNTSDLKEYQSLLSTILTELRVNIMPKCSYIIGASNGFGKTTFVNTAIKVMMAFDRKVVPYLSLSEIAELMNNDYKRIKKHLEKRVLAEDESETDMRANECTWSDFVNADLVFCCLTGTDDDCMWIEMSTLKRLLQLRGSKGRATVVMVAESLDWYRNNEAVRKYILNEIIEVNGSNTKRYDKLIHKSVSLVDKKSIMNK